MLEAAALCLALNAYHEARSEGMLGMIAVAQVAAQRAEHPSGRWARDYCAVVKQGGTRRHKCQFSWYCDGKSDVPREPVAWVEAQQAARFVLAGLRFTHLTSATCYHAVTISFLPAWTHGSQRIGRWRDHIYYEC